MYGELTMSCTLSYRESELEAGRRKKVKELEAERWKLIIKMSSSSKNPLQCIAPKFKFRGRNLLVRYRKQRKKLLLLAIGYSPEEMSLCVRHDALVGATLLWFAAL